MKLFFAELVFYSSLTICCLAARASPICANFGPKNTNSTLLGLVPSLKMMMFCWCSEFAVPESAQPNENLTIPGTFVVKGQVYWFDDSCHLLECKKLHWSFGFL